MKVLQTASGNYIINGCFVSPQGKILREVNNESEMEYLENVCEQVELPENFNLSEVERYKTFSALWAEEITVISEARRRFLESITSSKYSYRIPSDLGEYEIRELEKSDIYSDFGGDRIEGYYISTTEVEYKDSPLTPDFLAEKKPLFIIMKVYSEDNEIMNKLILKCKDLFDEDFKKAWKLALAKAIKELGQ